MIRTAVCLALAWAILALLIYGQPWTALGVDRDTVTADTLWRMTETPATAERERMDSIIEGKGKR